MSEFSNHAFINQKVPPNILAVYKELLCLLRIPEVLVPCLGRVGSYPACPDVSGTLPEPVFTHGCPASDINPTSLPGSNLWPP